MVERLVGTARELSRGFAGLGQRVQCVHWWRAVSYVLSRRGTVFNRGRDMLVGKQRQGVLGFLLRYDHQASNIKALKLSYQCVHRY
jgi:hypothetical protein